MNSKAHQTVSYHVSAGDTTLNTASRPSWSPAGVFILTTVVASNGATAVVTYDGAAQLSLISSAGYISPMSMVPGLIFKVADDSTLVFSRSAAGTATFIGYWE